MSVQPGIFDDLAQPKTGPKLYAILCKHMTGDGCSKTARDLGWSIAFVTDKERAEICRSAFPLPLSLAKQLYKQRYITGGYRAGSSIFEELPRELWRRKSRRNDIGDYCDWYLDDMVNLAKIIQNKGKL